MGERPRTVAFGDNETVNVMDVKRMLDIDRYGRVSVDAATPEMLYPDRGLLAPEKNLGFLRRCVDGFRWVNFASQASGRIYLKMEAGVPIWVDRAPLQSALSDPDTQVGVQAVARDALNGTVAFADRPQYLRHHEAEASKSPSNGAAAATLGVWGDAQDH
jgi:hypothetical protein